MLNCAAWLKKALQEDMSSRVYSMVYSKSVQNAFFRVS